ncbi:MAG: UDP-N-acetylmuramoyl-tripeptide--D-alanyl-D-alanine ligase [Candidatus Gracilibacteria bacterium]|jgi:UDP-N-acetylmuramoyl-tripeptide--D-alanyl-D-alanine ligase
MKAILRDWVLKILQILAKRKLRIIRPTVVGITGSAGKTSAKEVIYEVLSRRFVTKKSEKNLNSQFGVVLTILGLKSGYSSASAWGKILLKAVADAFKTPEKYEVLVLEMGVDRPGEMSQILEAVTPDIMVFLNVKNVHLGEGQFPNRQAIFSEKSRACAAVPKEGWVVLNHDDPFVRQLEGHLPARAVTIGTEEGSDLRATSVHMGLDGLGFTLQYEDKEMPVVLPHVLGRQHTTMVLAAIAVGFIQGLPWKAIDLALREYHLPPGRMNKIEGKEGSLIIDSSYNASPDTTAAALEILSLFHGRKIAALGTMNELGELSESEHIKIGKLAAEHADMLLAVGERARELAEGAQRGGMSASMIHTFKSSKEAGQFLSNILERHDTVLAKGSQTGVQMEHLVKLCMKDPSKARELLIRQEPYWLSKL